MKINKVLGGDIPGYMEAVGAVMTQLGPGQEVYGVSAGSTDRFAEFLSWGSDSRVLNWGAAVPV